MKMLRVEFKEPTFIHTINDDGNVTILVKHLFAKSIKTSFIVGSKIMLINDEILYSLAYYTQIKSIEHVKPTDL